MNDTINKKNTLLLSILDTIKRLPNFVATFLKLDQTVAQTLTASPVISSLTASQAVMTDASKKLVSADYLNQAVKTTSDPAFNTILLPTSSATAGFLKINNLKAFHCYGKNNSNVFVGLSSGNVTLDITNSQYNVGIGYNTLIALTGTGANKAEYNLAVGAGALQACTDGFQNTAYGSDALKGVTTGSLNIGIGKSACPKTTTGTSNIGIGPYTLNSQNGAKTNNTAIGNLAMRDATAGEYQVAIGYAALLAASGDGNVGIGREAGESITTGTYNVFVGQNAGHHASQKVDATNSIAIGKDAYTTATNQIVLGNSSITAVLTFGTLSSAGFLVGATAGIDATVAYTDTLLGAKTLTFTKGILTAQV